MLRTSIHLSLYRNAKQIIRGVSSLAKGRRLIGVTHEVENESRGLFCIPRLINGNDFMRLTKEKMKNAQTIVDDIIKRSFELNPIQIIYQFDRFVAYFIDTFRVPKQDTWVDINTVYTQVITPSE